MILTRQRARHRSAQLPAALLAVAACSSGTTPATAPLAHSFEVRVTPLFPENIGFSPADDSVYSFRLRLDDAGDTTTAIVTSQHHTVLATLQRDGTDRVLIASLDVPFDVEDPCNGAFRHMRYEALTLAPLDDDDDGVVDRLAGEASGTMRDTPFGTVLTVPMEASLAGRLDDTPPTLELTRRTPHHVLDPITIHTREPLAADTSIRLRTAEGQAIELEPCCVDGAPTEFRTPQGAILPANTTLAVEVSPALRDLAGNEAPVPALSVDTIADPGVFVEDGFESMTGVLLDGDAVFVSQLFEVPPITGERSLLVAPQGRATMRIPVTAGASRLSMSMRALTIGELIELDATITIRSTAGTSTSLDARSWLAILGGRPQVMNAGTWQYATNIISLGGALPEGTTDEVYLDIQVGSGQCAWAGSLANALLIDDVRLE